MNIIIQNRSINIIMYNQILLQSKKELIIYKKNKKKNFQI